MANTTIRRRWNRRAFLRDAGRMVVAAPLFLSSSVLGRDGSVSPNDRITLGFIGVGMMGRGHLRGFVAYDQAQVLAVCDVDQVRRDNARSTVEQAYAARQQTANYRGCEAYRDLRELLARPDVDAVVIATGDRWHALASVMAAQAGKDIYCEKPVSCTIREARAIVVAARRYDRVFQVGLQQRSTAEFKKACRLVLQGRLGKVHHVYVCFPGTNTDVNLPAEPVPPGLDWDLWLGPAPWRPFNHRFHHYGPPQRVVPWHFCRDFGGGNLTSNAVHAFDVVQWGLGMDESGPVEIIPPETGDVPMLTYRYANGTILQVDWKLDPAKVEIPKGWDPNRRIENFGALFVGEKGWIHVGRRGVLEGYPDNILDEPATGTDENPVDNHHLNWLACIRSRERPACDISAGCRSTIVSHLGCIAHWTRRPLHWDPEQEQFVGDDDANRYVARALREPWQL